MEHKKVGIAKARIKISMDVNIYCLTNRGSFSANIFFEEKTTHYFKNIFYIHCGRSINEAKINYSKLLKKFHSAKIYNDDEVVVLFDQSSCKVLAISKPGENMWIDIRNNFKKEKLNKLNFSISDLTVY